MQRETEQTSILTTQLIPLRLLHPNKGQIKGLPKNPRTIRKKQFELLLKSIHEDPEMLNLREVLVYDNAGELIIIGGNMRFKACKKLGYKTIPCKVIPPETSVEKLRAISVKDNHENGEWDWDLLANEWDVSEVLNFGVELPFIDNVPPEDKEEEKASKITVCPFCGEQFTLPHKGGKTEQKKGVHGTE